MKGIMFQYTNIYSFPKYKNRELSSSIAHLYKQYVRVANISFLWPLD